VPVEKQVEAGGRKNVNAGERNGTVYMGTVVTSGRGKAVVCSTGMMTEMGKIADMIQNIETEQTPLQKRLDTLGKYIVYGCLTICAIVTVTGILRGEKTLYNVSFRHKPCGCRGAGRASGHSNNCPGFGCPENV